MRIFNIVRPKRRVLLTLLIVIIFSCLIPAYSLDKESYKILMVGLDGAGWRVILPLTEEGKLPNIKKLMDNGCWGNLCWGNLKTFFIPSVSEVVWTTIATGKPPHTHGITNRLMKDPDTNELVSPTSNLRKVKAIWNILTEQKKKVGVVGYQVSWPAERVNGVMISAGANESSYFSSHYSEPSFESLCTEEIFNSFKEIRNIPAMLIEQEWVFKLDSFVLNFSRYLLKKQEFDFFCLYFRGIDVLSHPYWEYMFPYVWHTSPEDISRYKDVIKDYYIWCDNAIGDLLKIIDKNTTVIIVSDHGFQALSPKEDKYIFSGIDNLLKVCELKESNYNSKMVTLENTKSNYGEYKKNIQIIGELSKEEFKAVRENAKNILKNIKVIETGQPIFKISMDTDVGFVLEVDKVRGNKAPEHHILINNREYKILDFFTRTRKPDSGGHDKNDAIIIISGKNIRQCQHIKGANVYDITPTLLYLLDLPVAADMSGKVLVNAITRDLLNEKSVRHIGTYEKNERETLQKPIRSPEEERIIKERMRSLGYIN